MWVVGYGFEPKELLKLDILKAIFLFNKAEIKTSFQKPKENGLADCFTEGMIRIQGYFEDHTDCAKAIKQIKKVFS